MRRSEFITLLGSVAIVLPLAARAQQQPKISGIGVLLTDPAGLSTPLADLAAFLQGLRELGYTDGQNLTVEFRYGEWKWDRLGDLAAELVALKVNVIIAASTPAA